MGTLPVCVAFPVSRQDVVTKLGRRATLVLVQRVKPIRTDWVQLKLCTNHKEGNPIIFQVTHWEFTFSEVPSEKQQVIISSSASAFSGTLTACMSLLIGPRDEILSFSLTEPAMKQFPCRYL